MRVAASSTPSAAAAHHHHHYHPYSYYRKPSAIVLRPMCRNQQPSFLSEPLEFHQHQQHDSPPVMATAASPSLEHSKLQVSVTQRRSHNQRWTVNSRQRHHPLLQPQQQQQQQQQSLYTSSSSSSCSFEEQRQPPSPSPPSPSTVPSLQSTPSSSPASTPQRSCGAPSYRRPRGVHFQEQVSLLPTASVVLTPELIDDLWYSRKELDDCKLQVRNDFWKCVRKSPTTTLQQQQPPASPNADDEDMCWVGMERYWDAVHISSTQKGLKQAVLQAQREQQQQQQQDHHQYHDHHMQLVLGNISQQWSRTCQERAWWYASMVTEQVYGKGLEDQRRRQQRQAEQQPQQQQQQQRMIMDETYDYHPTGSRHTHGGYDDYYSMETEQVAAPTAVDSYTYRNHHHHYAVGYYERA